MENLSVQSVRVGDSSIFRQGHDFHGPVTFTSTQAKQDKPRPRSLVPFRRDDDFVHRDVLDQIHLECCKPAARVALVGFGGVGKSQLAIEYSYRIREQSPDTWVFWIHASSATRFEEGYRNIAEAAQIPYWNDPNTDILRLVNNWLTDESNGRWTMIIDNADDIGVLFCHSAAVGSKRRLIDYLPKSCNGSILVTSRNKEAAIQIVESWKNVFEVGPMDGGLAVELLRRKLPPELYDKEFDHLQSLVRILDHFPLAIAQAAAYIVRRTPLVTPLKYLQMLEADETTLSKVLNRTLRDGRRDDREYGEDSYKIIATWKLSFEHIRRIRRSASDLLSLMSLLDYQDIPEELLQIGTDEIDFLEDVQILRDFSLITYNDRDKTFDMHRLLHFATREWLRTCEELLVHEQRCIESLVALMPDPDIKPQKFKPARKYYSHVQIAVRRKPRNAEMSVLLATLLYRTASFVKLDMTYAVAEKMYRQSFEEFERILGPEHPSTLSCMNNVARCVVDRGCYEEGRKLFQTTIERREKVFGKENPKTLLSMLDLSITLQKQGRYEESMRLLTEISITSENVYGEKHYLSLYTKQYLARYMQDQYENQQAKVLCRKILEISARELGIEHLFMMRSVQNLSEAEFLQGLYKRAKELQEKVINWEEENLGKDHPNLIMAYYNLARIQYKMGGLEEANKLYEQTVRLVSQTYGKDHLSMIIVVEGLAEAALAQGDLEKAEKLYEQVLETKEMALGSKHPESLKTLYNFARTLHHQGKLQKAKEAYLRVIEGGEKVLNISDKEYPITLGSLNDLGLLHYGMENEEEAERLFRRALEGRVKLYGKEHPDVRHTVHNLFYLLRKQKRNREADELQQQFNIHEGEKIEG